MRKKVVVCMLDHYVRYTMQKLPDDVMGLFKINGLTAYLSRPALESLILQYHEGKLNTVEFKRELDQIFSEFESFTLSQFQNKWNYLCNAAFLFMKKAFSDIKRLQDEGVDVYILGNTNPLHVNYIEEKLGPIPGNKFWSFQHGVCEEALLTLLKRVIKDIKQKHKEITKGDIAVFYRQTTETLNSNLDMLKWFVSPQTDQDLKKQNRFLVVSLQINNRKPQIWEKINDMGWLRTPPQDNPAKRSPVKKGAFPITSREFKEKEECVTPCIFSSLEKSWENFKHVGNKQEAKGAVCEDLEGGLRSTRRRLDFS